MNKLCLMMAFSLVGVNSVYADNVRHVFSEGDIICRHYDSETETCESLAQISINGDRFISEGTGQFEIGGSQIIASERQVSKIQGDRLCLESIEMLDITATPENPDLLSAIQSSTVAQYEAITQQNSCSEYVTCNNIQYGLTYMNGEYMPQLSGSVNIFSKDDPKISELKLRNTDLEKMMKGLEYPTACSN